MVVACDAEILFAVTVGVLIVVISAFVAIDPTVTVKEPCCTSSEPVLICKQV
jgi:hypothetical protein